MFAARLSPFPACCRSYHHISCSPQVRQNVPNHFNRKLVHDAAIPSLETPHNAISIKQPLSYVLFSQEPTNTTIKNKTNINKNQQNKTCFKILQFNSTAISEETSEITPMHFIRCKMLNISRRFLFSLDQFAQKSRNQGK